MCANGHASAHPRYRSNYPLAPLRPPANKVLMKPWERRFATLAHTGKRGHEERATSRRQKKNCATQASRAPQLSTTTPPGWSRF
ncbi:hypothetical protein BDP55DRAFT_726841 [Colletotrichum godetiae]|uniref:Uncharacterized protein n=1 Tax=Colletotrichum godetiae TaxID=1209918 RepID=A0AAJ0APD9_9PEZI|nr:uncharacterized protein BDP55DRAFT_726841 [Colletotrichum godetiae]KAK1687944.1 hypothetical protein BDP55DRAFT_726841 [Colletotrichum godetiae]